MLDYLTVKEAGEKWNISGRMVTVYCNNGKIKGAVKKRQSMVDSSRCRKTSGRKDDCSKESEG